MDPQHIRILNLEDSALDADLIVRELKRARLDASVSRVETEAAFRAALENSDPDIILADYNLPGFDGIEALKIARDLVPEIPFIFVSGSIGEDRAVQALLEGATDYVIKDRLSRLPSAITRALAGKRERQLRLRAQEGLRLSEERFRHAANATQEVIHDWNLLTDKMTFNEAIRTAWGHALPEGEVDASWWKERIHPDDRQTTLESIDAAIAGGDDRWAGEYRFQCGDRTWGHVVARGIIIRDPRGKAHRAICTMLDVTEYRKAAERVQESELRFRSVAETAAEAIILSDMEGKIVFWNAGATRLFGYSSPEIVGQKVAVLMPERHRAAYEAGMQRYRQTGEARLAGRVLELEGLRKDGREFPLEMSLTLWKARGETFFTGLVRDITARVAYDRRTRIQFAVAKTLSEAPPVGEIMPQLLKNIGEELRWQVGLCWRYDADARELRCTNSWSAPGFSGDEFLELSKNVVLPLGKGLPGLVALSGRPMTVDRKSTTDGDQFPRAAAGRVGFKQAVAFPIVERGMVTAVMEFSSTRQEVDDESFLDVVTDAGQRIGEFFERRRSEEELHQSEANLAEAQNIAQLGSFSFDVVKGIVEWSAQTCHIFGKPENFQGSYESYLACIHPDDREFVASLTTPPNASSSPFRHRIVRGDGEVRSVQCRVRVVAGTSEAPQNIVGTVQDITEQVEAEETIKRLSRQNEMILHYAAEGILGIDTTGKVLFANPAAAKFSGWSVEELRAAPNNHDLMHHTRPGGEPYPQNECPLFLCMADGTPRGGQETFWRKSGESFPVDFSCSPILDGRRIVGCVAMFEDITERARLQHQLDQANRVSGLGRVAATIAHEFNNVLMGIQPFAEVIKRRSEDEKILKAAAQITNSVTRGKRVTQEILRFTQPADPALQPLEFGEWLQDLLPELQNLAGSNIEIVTRLTRVVLRCDPAQLQQVLTNLVLNARDAMAGTGVITIGAEDELTGRRFSFGSVPPSQALITVTDTGSGMPPEVLKKIFEPLFTTKRTGTGLGLAVAQQVLASHGGSIHAESKPGQGTTFFILLQLATAEAGAIQTEQAATGSRMRRVVLVEDESAVAAGITLLLDMEGVQTRIVERGGEALEAIDASQPDAVILDMSLPDMRGTDVYELIAARYPQLPVLFSSGDADESTVEKYSASGKHVAFLRKPYDLAALMEALNRITRPLHERQAAGQESPGQQRGIAFDERPGR